MKLQTVNGRGHGESAKDEGSGVFHAAPVNPRWAQDQEATLRQIEDFFRETREHRRRDAAALPLLVERLTEELHVLSEYVSAPWSPPFATSFRRVLGLVKEISLGFAERRVHGDYETDDFGFDPELALLFQPVLDVLFERWWRVEVHGVEHIPTTGKALYIANHSGLFPWDGLMVRQAVRKAGSSQSHLRSLANPNHFRVPFFGSFLNGIGVVANHPENCQALLGRGESVIAFPGGDAALARGFTDPYRVPSFQRCGYVEAALQEQAAILPVAVVGAHESYPILSRFDLVGKILGLPMFPITPFFPFGPPFLWAVPLPVKWMVTVLPPVPTARYASPDEIGMDVGLDLEEDLHALVQDELKELLRARGPLFG